MKVLIAGAGAIGCWLGARLLDAGHEVTLLGRAALRDAVAKDGLRITGHTDLHVKPRVETMPPEDAHGVVIMTCKAHATAAMCQSVQASLDPDGVLVSLQNGLGNLEAMLGVWPAEQTVVALTSNGIMARGPADFEHAGLGATTVAPAASMASASRVHALFTEAGLEPALVDDPHPFVWQKAIVNAGINPVAAIDRVANGKLLGPDRWPRVEALVREAVSVAEASGVVLPPGDLVGLTRTVCERTAANRCSMVQDVLAGRRTEIEQISGHIRRLGDDLGIATPHTDVAYQQVRALERIALGT